MVAATDNKVQSWPIFFLEYQSPHVTCYPLGNGGEFPKKQWWPFKETVSGTFLCTCRLVSCNILHRSLFVDHEFDYRQNWMKGSPVTMQWVKTVTMFEREIRHRLCFHKKNLTNCARTKWTNNKYCYTLTQAWRVNCLYTLPNY